LAETVRIDRRFRGPPDSGNGGYVCGLVARALGGSGCEVTLHAPPPLDRALHLEVDESVARLLDGETLIASANPAEVDLDVPPPPTFADARSATARFTGFTHHIFPACFVCGPDRAEGDGLRIFAGEADGQVAAPWTPDPSLFDEGVLRSEFVWAALDCPGYFAVEEQARPALLGRLAVRILEPAIAPQPLVVTGWPISQEGRKHVAGTALHTAEGRLLAIGRATWIRLKGEPA
jgi:acyl-coenzyme A thioesterase PaaI-like protein